MSKVAERLAAIDIATAAWDHPPHRFDGLKAAALF